MKFFSSYQKKIKIYSTKRLDVCLSLNKLYLSTSIGFFLLCVSALGWFIKEHSKIIDEIDGLNIVQVYMAKELNKKLNLDMQISFDQINKFSELSEIKQLLLKAKSKMPNEDLVIQQLIETSQENWKLLYPKILILFDPTDEFYAKQNKKNPEQIVMNEQKFYIFFLVLIIFVFIIITFYYIYKINLLMLELDEREKYQKCKDW